MRFRSVACRLLVLAAAVAPGTAAPPPPAEEPQLTLPLTLDKIWFRPGGRRAIGGAKDDGELTITAEGLEFSTGKQTFVWPLSSVQVLSFGRMRGDVNTEWVVLGIDGPGREMEVIGFRDGRKLGYGEATRRIYDTLLQVLRQTRSGPYHAPEGFVPYDEMRHQFILALPSGWSDHHALTSFSPDGEPTWGRIVFAEAPLDDLKSDHEALEDVLDRVSHGESPGFYLERREAAGGMRCEGFKKSAAKKLSAWIGEAGTALPPDALSAPDPVPIGACLGLRYKARLTAEHGGEIVADVRAVSDDSTVYVFGLHAGPERYDEWLNWFEQVVGSFRTSVAR